VRQALLAPQMNGVQATVAGLEQAPEPVQVAAGVKALPTQEATPQTTLFAACWQVPLALQRPVLPQVPLGAQPARGAAVPAGTFVQVPRVPVRLQAWQVPQPLLAQQTPSAQKPELHSAPAVQVVPLPFFETQVPPAPVQ
jgi:hypothetical protein